MKTIFTIMVFSLLMCNVARAEEATVESIDSGVITLDNGDTITGDEGSRIQVGDTVEIDKTYTNENGDEFEEY